ncbi:MAG: hypothetical protein NTZ74_00260 [Chloroflexi bacterium]|nr:hypothetical protein [Chloroflexota bacterium]
MRTWTDTKLYVQVATYPFFSNEFWIAERPFVLPLFYKLLGMNLSNFTEYKYLAGVVKIQVLVGAFSWILLAFATSRQLKNNVFRVVSTAFVLLVGLGLHSSLWDKLVLTESLSNSLFIVFLSLILFIDIVSKTNKSWGRVLFLISVGITALLYAFIRDVNAYLLFIAGLSLLLYRILVKDPLSKTKIYLNLSILFLAVSLLSLINSNLTNRWRGPLVNVLKDRKVSQPVLADFFMKNGVDLFQKFPNTSTDPLAEQLPATLASINDLAFLKECKAIYVKFLVTHPLYLISAPLNQLNSLISPDSTEYEYRFEPKPTYPWVVALTNIGYPRSNWVLAIGIIAALVGLFIARPEARPFLWFLLVLNLSVIPLALLIWHADTMEIERHAEHIMIQTRLGFWLSLVFLIDCILARFNAGKIIPQTDVSPETKDNKMAF